MSAFVLFLGVAAFVASLEGALLGITESRVRHAIEQGVSRAGALLYWVKEAPRILATLRFVLLVCVAGVSLTLPQLMPLLGWNVHDWVAIPICAWVVMVTCYMVARPIFINRGLTWGKWFMGPIKVLTIVLSPIVWPMVLAGKGLLALFGRGSEGGGLFWTADTLEQAAADARADLIGEPGEQLMESIISFSDTLIREIMVPRTEMVAVSTEMSTDELRTLIVSTGHSRIPVYEETVDNVLGVLHVKDFLLGEPEDSAKPPVFSALLRSCFYVPEVMKISELLRDFQRRKTHMAIVVDEYGGTAGVVTLEDIIEEIVGEIQDEYDVDDKQFRQVGDNKIIADARVNLGDLEEIWELAFPDDGTYETLGGFLMAQAGYLPEAGTCIRWENLVFTVKEANEKRVKLVEVERGPRSELVTAPVNLKVP